MRVVTDCPDLPVWTKATTREWNKKAAVLMTRHILRQYNKTKHLEFFAQFKKQDDLADSFLLGLYHLRLNKRRRTTRDRFMWYIHHGKRGDDPSGETVTLNEGCEYEKEMAEDSE
jgi:hypothetical protein